MSPELVMSRLQDEVLSSDRLVILTKGEAQCIMNKVNYLEMLTGQLIASLMEKGIKIELPSRTEDKG